MGRRLNGSQSWLAFAFFATSCLFAICETAQAETYAILHTFVGYPNDGAWPTGGLISDNSGNLYGTTFEGGSVNCPYSSYGGCGTVFKVAPDGTETILYSFGSGTDDGISPLAGLIIDSNGNLYGTTVGGGAAGCGTVFKIAPDGTETIIYSFAGGNDGCNPWTAGVSMDNAGNLYGTTIAGGDDTCRKLNGGGCGTVYKIAPDGTETKLYDFANKKQGWQPLWGVIVDKKDTVYGTAQQDKHDSGGGIVFKIPPDGRMHIVHQFAGYPSDGEGPGGPLVRDKAGNLFGTTSLGGTYNWGTVFKLAADGTETLLYNFTDGSDGYEPDTLIEDSKGNFFGLAGSGNGLVYQLSASGQEKILYNFSGGTEGWGAEGKIVRNKTGTIYGTLAAGGTGCDSFGCGVVYSLSK